MSSDDDPATNNAPLAQQQQPKSAEAQPQPYAAQHQQQPLAPPKVPHGGKAAASQPPAEDGPSSSSTGPLTIPGSGRSKDFWSANSITNEPSTMESSQTSSNGSHIPPRPSRWTKARSTSTESSLSLSGITTFGSTYNQDGFPNYPASSEDEHMAMDDAAIARQLALTDEAVRAINGTPGVVQAGSLGRPITTANAYELPRNMAAFVRRPGDGTTGERDLRTGRSFVSSGSSTSSEESEHLASVQWVTTAVNSTPQYTYSPYPVSRPLAPPQRTSPSMPPPPSTTKGDQASPRQNGNGTPLPNTLGLGADHGLSDPRTNSGNLHNIQQTSGSAEGSPENNNGDDDDATVGGMREGSPSSSSASGLDLLSHAAAHHERTRYSSSVRRKAGAEAVAQWRGEMMANPGYDSPGYESTPSAEGTHGHDGAPPKKRRKSNMMESPGAGLRQLHQPQQSPSERGDHADEGASGSEASGSDSEYHGQGGKGRKRGTGKGKRPRVRATLLVPPPVQPPAKPPQATPKKGSGKTATPTSSKAATAATAERRGSGASDGTAAGAASSAKLAGGVQCDYVNPLPPYQRCPDVFTRKYDIPRHMARHARREGDLVAEGKLPEEKAMLWKTIRDKPRIRCKTCGEYFTRQDALKRHQSKQHH